MSTNTISGLPNCGFTNMINLPIRQASKDRCFCPDSSPANASLDLGDIDKDQDIDLIITGFSAADGLKCIIYENVTNWLVASP
jgi:hypothetical protein